jgi:uncharacterized membrane protein
VGFISRVWDRWRSGFWLIPLALVLAAVAAAIVLIAVDRTLQQRGAPAWTYAGGPQNASDTLSTIASSMITFTGLVFSITVVALQLTSSQLSPRALQTFLRDRVSQLALGVFVATFAYAFAALSAVRVAAGDDESFVPAITVTGAYALVSASVVMFVHFIHHTAQSMRAVNVIARIAAETHGSIEATHPDAVDVSPAPQTWPMDAMASATEVLVPDAGVITDVDLDGLAELAEEHDGFVEVLEPVGAFVPSRAPLLRWHGPSDGRPDDAKLLRRIGLERERTLRRDPGAGFRQLTDIAERALSPGINDPTTALQCLDRIHDLLREVTRREVPDAWTAARDGVVRIRVPAVTYESYLEVGLDEIAHYGTGAPRVTERIRAIVDDLLTLTDDPERIAVLEKRR